MRAQADHKHVADAMDIKRYVTALGRLGVLGGLLLTVGATDAADSSIAPAQSPAIVTHQDGGWTLQAERVQRGQLAQQLARLSGTALQASTALMDRAPPVSVQLHARSLAEAWRAVLGDEFSHALMCAGKQCRVWVMGLVPRALAPRHAPRMLATPDQPPHAPVIRADPPGLFPSEPAADTESAGQS